MVWRRLRSGAAGVVEAGKDVEICDSPATDMLPTGLGTLAA